MGRVKNETKDIEKDKWKGNKTYPDGPPKRTAGVITKVINMMTRFQRTVVFEGNHGIGKTAYISSLIEEMGYRVVMFSLAVLMPTDMAQQIPVTSKLLDDGASDDDILNNPDAREELNSLASKAAWELKTHLTRTLVSDEEWVLVLDEANRVQQMMIPMLMEITQSHRVLGERLENLAGIVMLRNPAGAGYAVIGGDLASESRYPVIPVTANDIPFWEWLALEFPHLDLKPLRKVVDRLDAEARRVVAPRIIHHFLQTVDAGLPPILAIPILPSGRQKIKNKADDDITVETLRKMCDALNMPYRESVPDQLATATRIARERGWNVRIVGAPGVGKTAFMHELSNEDHEFRVVSAANMEPTTLLITVPVDNTVMPILSDKVRFKGKGTLVLDEYTLAPKHVKPQLLELVQQRTLGGEKPEGLVSVWALDNPSKVENIPLRNRTADEAMISRFTLNIEVTAADFDWRSHLEGIFGEEFVAPFAKWWARLEPSEKAIIMPRVLHMMMELHAEDLDVDYAIPFLGPDRAPVRTQGLKAQLSGRKVLGLDELVAHANEIIGILNDPQGDQRAQMDTAQNVVRLLQTADIKDLEPHEDILVEYIKALPADRRTAILGAAQAETNQDQSQRKLLFWSNVFGKTLV